MSVNGELIGTFSAEDEGSNEAFTTCNGDQISLSYSPGDYENENSYFLLASGGTVIFSDGPEPFVGNSGPFDTNCDLEPEAGTTPCVPIQMEIDDCISVDNTSLIGSGLAPNCSNYDGGDIWYGLTVPESGSIVFQTSDNGGINDTGIQLWFGNDCLDLEEGPCDDDAGSGYFSFITASELMPGDQILVQLWGYGGAAGTFEFCATDPGIIEVQESPLPIFLINTNGQEIVDEPKIDVNLQIIYNGPNEINYITDDPNHYDGNIGIEIRGATSAGYPQTPYSFETRDEFGENNNVSLIDLPVENDWVLLSNYNDKTFMRNLLANHLFERMGEYGPRTKLCEVLINDDYKGIYAFTEKIKVDNDRVDIANLGELENDGDDVTGGYILELNYWNDQNSWELGYTPLDHPDFDVHLVYKYPKADVITAEQKDYIQSYVDSMENALYGINFMDPELGYRNYLDVESFIDYFLINELSRNNDGFKKSRYFHKDKASNGGLFKAGPTWDFDWAWKDMYSCEIFENQDGSGWAHLINTCPTDNYSPDWYLKLHQDSTYVNQLKCRWEEYREDFLNESYINNYVDSVASLVSTAQERHYQKWPVLGLVTASPEIEPVPDSFQGEVDFFKNWISLRINWLDDNLLGVCTNQETNVPSLNSTIEIFPNPNSGSFELDCKTCLGKWIQIHNLIGQVVWEGNYESKMIINIESEPGVYILSIQGTVNKKIVID